MPDTKGSIRNIRTKLSSLNLTAFLALLPGLTIAAPPELPGASEYRGEIRRGPDGALGVTSQAATNIGEPRTLQVGKLHRYPTIAAAAKDARDGDTVEIEAGDYVGDVAIWAQENLTIRGVGGRAKLIANGQHVERKGIWIVRGGKITVENIEFHGAKVEHRNGAGIRFEKGHLILRNCAFFDNENGILTHNDETSELDIENSEFGRNGYGDGQSHNIYAGTIKKFRLVGTYSHHANIGQLVKSRAKVNYILYNRLSDETGRASYEIDLPSGGISYVIGNIIQQSATTENGHMISFGVEGYKWEKNELYLINNTIIDNRPANGKFFLVKPGPGNIHAVNNIIYGPDEIDPGARKNDPKPLNLISARFSNNIKAKLSDFTSPNTYDYTLRRSSPLVGKTSDPGEANGLKLVPKRQYLHPAKTQALQNFPSDPGAIQPISTN